MKEENGQRSWDVFERDWGTRFRAWRGKSISSFSSMRYYSTSKTDVLSRREGGDTAGGGRARRFWDISASTPGKLPIRLSFSFSRRAAVHPPFLWAVALRERIPFLQRHWGRNEGNYARHARSKPGRPLILPKYGSVVPLPDPIRRVPLTVVGRISCSTIYLPGFDLIRSLFSYM